MKHRATKNGGEALSAELTLEQHRDELCECVGTASARQSKKQETLGWLTWPQNSNDNKHKQNEYT